MNAERIVITGTGVLCASGMDSETFADAVERGDVGLTPIEGFDLTPFDGRYAGQIHEFDPSRYDPDPGFTSLDRHVQLAVVAAAEACERSAAIEAVDPGRRALVMATCNGGWLSIERHHRMLHGLERGHLDEDLELAKRHHSAALELARRHGVAGPVLTVVTACAASTNAIGLARDLLRTGRADAVLAGGADSFSATTFAGFDRLKTTSSAPCAPFSTPLGLNLGEGAGFWVLEREADALERGAKPLGFVLGYGTSNDAHHPTLPDPRGQGLTLCLERAVRDAAVAPEAIGYVNAHGTGTEANDKTESRVLARFFGECPPVSSSKSMFGHTLGAAGVLEATASLLSLRRGKLPPTASFAGPRDACPLDYVPDEARPTDATMFLSTNSAFGGANCALVAAVGDDPPPATAPSRRTAVITGLGAVSPYGVGLDDLREGLAANRCALRPVDRHDVEACSRREAGLVPPFVPRRVEPRLRLDGLDRTSQYTAIAARRALSDAELSLRPRACADVGFVLGLTHYPTSAEEQYLGSICRNGLGVPDLLHFPHLVLSSVSGATSRELLLKGPGTTLSTGHGAGLAAVARAADAVALGQVDRTLAGATDEVNERLHHDLDALGRLDRHAPGEGSVLLVLEDEVTARERGATPLARVMAHREAFWADPATAEQVLGFLSGLLDEAGLATAELAAVVPALERPSPHSEAAAAAVGDLLGPQRDLADLLGWSPAVSALYGLAGALAPDAPSGPILCFTLSRHGEVRGLITAPAEVS